MKTMNHRKYLLVILALALLMALWIPTPGAAQGIIYGDRVADGEVVDQNMILNGTDVSIDGTVNGDVLAVGRNITVNGQVNGTLVAIGESITINGQVINSVISAGILLELGPTATVGRDVYFVGARITLSEGSSIQRDLYCLSLEGQFAGEIGRDIHAIVGPLNIVQLIIKPIIDRFSFIGAVQPTSSLHISTPTTAGSGAVVLAPVSYWLAGEQRVPQQAAQIDVERLKSWALSLVRNLVALLLLGLIGIWLLPAQLNWTSEKIRKAPWRAGVFGLIYFIFGWVFAILAIVLVVMLALFFYSISLPNLGFLIGMLGLMGLGLAVAVFWLSIAYVSKIVVAILIGRLLLQRIAPKIANSNLWSLLLGIVLYVLVASIPYLGWVVTTIVTFLGLGALGMVSFPLSPKKVEVADQPALAGAD